jgi:hypothetical protein
MHSVTQFGLNKLLFFIRLQSHKFHCIYFWCKLPSSNILFFSFALERPISVNTHSYQCNLFVLSYNFITCFRNWVLVGPTHINCWRQRGLLHHGICCKPCKNSPFLCCVLPHISIKIRKIERSCTIKQNQQKAAKMFKYNSIFVMYVYIVEKLPL